MSQYYNIKQYQPGGEWKLYYGMFDSFFLEIEGHENDTVMTNKKQGNTPRLGQVYGELIFKKVGKKGQNVYQFKQLQVPDGEEAPAPTTAAPAVGAPGSERGATIPEWFAPYAVMIKAIYDATAAPVDTAELKEPFETPVTPVAQEESVPGTTMSKTELEDIFGGSMEPVTIED